MHLKCELRCYEASITRPECDADQADERGNLDQWSNDADERFARVRTEDCDSHRSEAPWKILRSIGIVNLRADLAQ